ncbi:BRCA1-associated ATM activator 1-like isoform X1 [Hydractinia symbiolongicarpus]|uniref:BRCA1-associated ATM activator 1-like isoform X1 n=1 Tax=Hydractinia symbiolongicarpus TaxID=13093 RepID=UPI00254E50E4|nr:BRCA1-associated ATM activator 1-like isoform X1 [Hydractinia symbiolongicarpus]
MLSQLEFIAELPTVFSLLKHNSEAIVDDTSIERLLNWLEEICKEKSKRLVDVSIPFLKAEEVWKHPVALSFALRYAGFLGCTNALHFAELYELIQQMLKKLVQHDLFTEPTVKCAYYSCLTSLYKSEHCCDKMQADLPVLINTFTKSYLYVKKTAVKFFANYLNAVVNKQPALDGIIKKFMLSEDMPVLGSILDSVTLLCELSISTGLIVLKESKLIKHSMIQTEEKKSTELLSSLMALFSVITSSEVEVDWDELILMTPSENVHSYLLEFVALVNKKMVYHLPDLCGSLIQSNRKRYFPPDWNSLLFDVIFKTVIYEKKVQDLTAVEERLPLQQWKKLLVSIITVMCKVLKKVKHDTHSAAHVDMWTNFCLRLLTVSLSCKVDISIDEYFLSIINNRKISRLCFCYLDALDLSDLNIEMKKKLVSCLWTCLSSQLDNSQMICSTLELLSKFISNHVENFTTVLAHQSTHAVTCMLNMKLLDVSWEVRDSVISVLLEIVLTARKGASECVTFLEQDSFWCHALDLIDDDESYVRSKTVKFLGEVSTYDPVWKIFCTKHTYNREKLWRRLELIFTSEARQDDMFTRRSILDVLVTWTESGMCTQIFFNNSTTERMDIVYSQNLNIRNSVLNILQNGSHDFDWEVRKLTLSVWTSIVSMSSNDENEWKMFVELTVKDGHARRICLGVSDCEYKVRCAALQCLQIFKNKLCTMQSISGNSTNFHISCLEDFDTFIASKKSFRLEQFEQILSVVDFSSLASKLEVIDISVKSDPVSFLHDIISSTKQSEENLLDCY